MKNIVIWTCLIGSVAILLSCSAIKKDCDKAICACEELCDCSSQCACKCNDQQ